MSLFSAVELAPRDPILGLNEAFNADTRTNKVNLGVGVYCNEEGRIPLLRAVVEAETIRVAQHVSRGYLPIDGIAAYDQAVQTLLFGKDSPLIASGRVITTQAVGGTGALKIGADFLKQLLPDAVVAISDPSWENHRALFETAGFPVQNYRYYDAATHDVNRSGLLEDLNALPDRSIVVLHACCHNPTGADLSQAQWDQVIAAVVAGGLIPFLDMAYQGFGAGIAEDGAVVRRFAATGVPLLVSNSFSKSFSLYGERVGALSVVAASADEAARLLSQLKRVVRTNYSNPPVHGGKVVATVLATPELRKLWEEELAGMRVRIKATRDEFVKKLKEKGHDFEFVREQVGMFSYSGLTKEQVAKLREQSIYAVDTGRICVAAMNSRNIDAVVDAVAKVL
jgi:aromatic-amino-acid transaminase